MRTQKGFILHDMNEQLNMHYMPSSKWLDFNRIERQKPVANMISVVAYYTQTDSVQEMFYTSI